jgi:cobalamin biosynthesis protein CbiD
MVAFSELVVSGLSALTYIAGGRWEFHMQVSSHDAVVMFARYCRARLGKAASRKVRATAKALAKRGDLEGEAVWNQVAEELEKGVTTVSTPAAKPFLRRRRVVN